MLTAFSLKASYRIILSYFCSLQLYSNSISVANKVAYPFCHMEELPGERSFILKNVQRHFLITLYADGFPNVLNCEKFS